MVLLRGYLYQGMLGHEILRVCGLGSFYGLLWVLGSLVLDGL